MEQESVMNEVYYPYDLLQFSQWCFIMCRTRIILRIPQEQAVSSGVKALEEECDSNHWNRRHFLKQILFIICYNAI